VPALAAQEAADGAGEAVVDRGHAGLEGDPAAGLDDAARQVDVLAGGERLVEALELVEELGADREVLAPHGRLAVSLPGLDGGPAAGHPGGVRRGVRAPAGQVGALARAADGVEGVERGVDPARRDLAVGVDERDDVDRAERAGAEVAHRADRDAGDQEHLVGQFPGDLQGAVRGAVVDDHDPGRRRVLRPQREQAPLDRGDLVLAGDDDAHPHRHDSSWSFLARSCPWPARPRRHHLITMRKGQITECEKA
jgi:hypothetical protein